MKFPENVVLSPLAKFDIQNISQYLNQEWGKNVLTKFLFKANWVINQIVINPQQYAIISSRLKTEDVLSQSKILCFTGLSLIKLRL